VDTTFRELTKAIPKIREISTKDVVIGLGYTGVRTDSDDVGLVFTHSSELVPQCSNIFSKAGTLAGGSTLELAKLSKSWDLSERIVGIAALNALSQHAIKLSNKRDSFQTKYGDVINLTPIRKSDVVVMIGNMSLAVERLRRRAKEVLILERSMGLRDENTFPDTAAEDIVPRGNVVIMTGATLSNGTADRLIELSKNAREVVMAGASAGI
jgi:uncharacterized protein